MEFCPICPTKYLPQFAGGSNTHLVLAQIYGREAAYADWYRARRAVGDTIILDNGAYEGELVTNLQLLKVILDLQPTVVVLPDEPGNFRETWRRGLDFDSMLKTAKVPVQTMRVIHAKDGDLQMFEEAYQVFALSSEWVALSRLTNSYGLPGEEPTLRRVQFINHLKVRGFWRDQTKVHCLGLLNGQVTELPRLARLGVNSIDSSAPIWRGLHGYSITNSELWNSWPDVPFDPDMDDGNAVLAEQNLNFVKEACRNGCGKK